MENDEKERKQKLSFRIQCLIENSKKITKKFKKLRNTIMNSFLAKIGWKRMRKRGIKIIVSFCSYPKRNRKFRKNNKKKLKNIIMDSFQAKIGSKMPTKRENKNYRSVSFLPDA